MPEQKKPKQDKKFSLHPLSFEHALKGLLQTEPLQHRAEVEAYTKAIQTLNRQGIGYQHFTIAFGNPVCCTFNYVETKAMAIKLRE